MNNSLFFTFLSGVMDVYYNDEKARPCSMRLCIMQHDKMQQCHLKRSECPQYTPQYSNKEYADFLRYIANTLDPKGVNDEKDKDRNI